MVSGKQHISALLRAVLIIILFLTPYILHVHLPPCFLLPAKISIKKPTFYVGFFSLRREGSNLRPSGYEPDELPLLYFAMCGVQMYGTNVSKTNKKRKAPDFRGPLYTNCCLTFLYAAGAAFVHFPDYAIAFYYNVAGAAGRGAELLFYRNFYI